MRKLDDAYPEGYDPMKEEALDRWARRWLAPIGYALVFLAFAYWIYGLKYAADRTVHIHRECGDYATMKCIEEAGRAFDESH